MNKIGIYPGTFDPITYGHIDVIKRSLKIVSKLIVAVSNDFSKDYLFSAEERVTIVKNSLFKDLKLSKIIKTEVGIRIETNTGATVCAKKYSTSSTS